MSPRRDKSITLLELLIALSILAILVVGLSSIDVFSRQQLIVTDQRSKIQNEASRALEHMAKNINKAIGGVDNTTVTITGSNITVYIDSNTSGTSGLRDNNDYEIAYKFDNSTHSVRYYSDYTNSPASYEIIATNITSLNLAYTNTTNYIEVSTTACWDAAGATYACGTINNPNITMSNRIDMPSVSVH